MRKHERFIRFLLTGGTSAVLTALVRYLLSMVISFQLAVAVAYVFGMTIAFTLSRIFVFAPGDGPVRQQYLRFALVNATAFPQVWLMSVGLAEYLFPAIGFTWHPELVAHVIGMATPVWSSYLGHKHFSFRPAPVLAPAEQEG